MVATPFTIPVAVPVEDPTVATAGALLVHVPPGVASANVVLVPEQICASPVIAAGEACTVTVRVAVPQPFT